MTEAMVRQQSLGSATLAIGGAEHCYRKSRRRVEEYQGAAEDGKKEGDKDEERMLYFVDNQRSTGCSSAGKRRRYATGRCGYSLPLDSDTIACSSHIWCLRITRRVGPILNLMCLLVRESDERSCYERRCIVASSAALITAREESVRSPSSTNLDL
ncbi:hypothetical protein GW17_00036614 [Ensete ventricosum]|nr:hypothetical protein GW17_00036614 [Ensete ventricosum]